MVKLQCIWCFVSSPLLNGTVTGRSPHDDPTCRESRKSRIYLHTVQQIWQICIGLNMYKAQPYDEKRYSEVRRSINRDREVSCLQGDHAKRSATTPERAAPGSSFWVSSTPIATFSSPGFGPRPHRAKSLWLFFPFLFFSPRRLNWELAPPGHLETS